MVPTHSIGKLNLEGLMSRAEILFTAAYVFKGQIDTDLLQSCFSTISETIAKLNHQIQFKAQNDFSWHPFEDYGQCFHVIDTPHIEDELKKLSARGFDVRSGSNNFPMNLVVLRSSDPGAPDQFAIAQMCSHEFLDARSAETLFHLIVDLYNARKEGNTAAEAEVLEAAHRLHTLDATEMCSLLRSEDYDLDANAQDLESYAVADIGDYGVRIDTLPELLPRFAERTRHPVSCVVDARPMIEKCREKYPDVTKNAVITAVLHKALYNLNVTHKNKQGEHIISGKTVSDLLSPEMRKDYIGNYIAFVPLTTRGEPDIEDIAKAVHERIVEFKAKQINLTCFELVEAAANENIMGTADEELSYVITNWNNYRFLADKNLIHGCESIAHLSAVNVDPKDAGGAALINRAIVVINLSFNDQLCFSMFPSLRNDDENRLLVAEVERLFVNA
ncbi:hypothetical protein OLMES_4954 [Oleiphilus messinensis]|uniref:Condensation domain-containing protein n=1 Tax=Oleiphilus messinensis TaxID=141451 RepID=A0A1Y0IEJ8_9GAMM|nr:hypothetical protein [Oleiphilus messinensis]ARU58942.1 hypothetical protein OLMES_4954 [Oleiphilus messinensis]